MVELVKISKVGKTLTVNVNDGEANVPSPVGFTAKACAFRPS